MDFLEYKPIVNELDYVETEEDDAESNASVDYDYNGIAGGRGRSGQWERTG